MASSDPEFTPTDTLSLREQINKIAKKSKRLTLRELAVRTGKIKTIEVIDDDLRCIVWDMVADGELKFGPNWEISKR